MTFILIGAKRAIMLLMRKRQSLVTSFEDVGNITYSLMGVVGISCRSMEPFSYSSSSNEIVNKKNLDTLEKHCHLIFVLDSMINTRIVLGI